MQRYERRQKRARLQRLEDQVERRLPPFEPWLFLVATTQKEVFQHHIEFQCAIKSDVTSRVDLRDPTSRSFLLIRIYKFSYIMVEGAHTILS